MTAQPVDGKYYQVAQPQSLGERVVVMARDRIHEDFIALCRPDASSRILDVGVSDVVTDAANVLERKWPHLANITAVGLGEGSAFRDAFPAVTYHQIAANKPLPFADYAFDVAASNAVLEHVGSPEAQVAFVCEVVRVSRKAFISVPNRYFPVEHHTAIPLLHYTAPTFRFACNLLGKSQWLDPGNLILMSMRQLKELVPRGCKWRVGFTGLKLGVFSSNAYLLLEKD